MLTPQVIATGEALVEIMRSSVDQPFHLPGTFDGPFPSGAPAVFADCAARLGASPGFVGAVGDDEFGRCVLERFARDGVDIAYVRRLADRPTGIAFITDERAGGRRYLFHIVTDAPVCIDPTLVVATYFQHVQSLCVNGGTLACGPCNVATYLAAIAAVHGVGAASSSISPYALSCWGVVASCLATRRVTRQADIVLPSAGEAERLTGCADPAVACARLLEWGATLVVAKHGPEGCVIHHATGRQAVPGFAVEEVDPTGAGDCFAAGLVCALLEGAAPYEAALFANAVGALAVTRRGPMEGAPRRSEADALLHSHGPL